VKPDRIEELDHHELGSGFCDGVGIFFEHFDGGKGADCFVEGDGWMVFEHGDVDGDRFRLASFCVLSALTIERASSWNWSSSDQVSFAVCGVWDSDCDVEFPIE